MYCGLPAGLYDLQELAHEQADALRDVKQNDAVQVEGNEGIHHMVLRAARTGGEVANAMTCRVGCRTASAAYQADRLCASAGQLGRACPSGHRTPVSAPSHVLILHTLQQSQLQVAAAASAQQCSSVIARHACAEICTGCLTEAFAKDTGNRNVDLSMLCYRVRR